MQTVLSRPRAGSSSQGGYRRLLTAWLLGTSFLVGAASPVALAAVEAEDDDLVDIAGLTPVGDQTLDDLRGGFSIGPYNVNFGMVIKTAINQQQVLMTSFKVQTLGKIEDVKHEFLAGWQSYLHDDSGKTGETSAANLTENQPMEQITDTMPPLPEMTTPLPEIVEQATTELADTFTPEQLPETETLVSQLETIGDQIPPAPEIPAPETYTTELQETLPSTSTVPEVGESFANFIVTAIENGFIVDNGEGTSVMHQVDPGVVTQIINVANGATVSHSTEMNIYVQNFSEVIGQHSLSMAMSSLAFEAARNNPLLGQ